MIRYTRKQRVRAGFHSNFLSLATLCPDLAISRDHLAWDQVLAPQDRYFSSHGTAFMTRNEHGRVKMHGTCIDASIELFAGIPRVHLEPISALSFHEVHLITRQEQPRMGFPRSEFELSSQSPHIFVYDINILESQFWKHTRLAGTSTLNVELRYVHLVYQTDPLRSVIPKSRISTVTITSSSNSVPPAQYVFY